MNKLILLLTFLFLIVNINAEVQILPSVKIDSCNDIPQTCNNCTYVNLTTISIQNGDTFYINQEMTKTGTHYNYTFCNNTLIGTYIVETCGDPNGVFYCPPPFQYEVTGSGFNTISIFYIIILLLGFGLIILAFSIQDGWVAILGSILVIFVGLFTIINGIDFIKDTTTTYAFGIVITFVGGYIGVKSAMETLDVF